MYYKKCNHKTQGDALFPQAFFFFFFRLALSYNPQYAFFFLNKRNKKISSFSFRSFFLSFLFLLYTSFYPSHKKKYSIQSPWQQAIVMNFNLP